VILLTAAVSSFKLIVFVVRGVQDFSPTMKDMADVMSLGILKRAVLLHVPSAAKSIMTGLRLTIARAYGAVVVVGLTTSGPGIGGELMRSKTAVNTPEVFAYALVAGLIGMAFFSAFSLLDRKLIFWTSTS